MALLMNSSPKGWYLAREVGLLAGVSGDTVGQWARRGYVQSSRSDLVPRVYSYQDVAEAMVVHELLDRQVPYREIRSALPSLRAEYGDWPLQVAPLATVGSELVELVGGESPWSAGRRRGQGVIELDDLRRIAKWLQNGGWVARMHPDITHVEVDPDRLSGKPTIKGRRMPVEKVALIAREDGGMVLLRDEYDLTRAEVGDAVRWYQAAAKLLAA